MSFCGEKEAKRLFKGLPFYNTSIEKPYIKRLNNIELLCELHFYNDINILKTSKAFNGYIRSYNIEITDSKDPSAELTISKKIIEDLFEDLADEIKGFKCQIALKVLSSKYKENRDEFAPAYFYSTKTVIGPKYGLSKSFQEVFNRLDNWISEGSCWITESIEAEYVNISIYNPLSRSSYIEFPDNFKNSSKNFDQY